MPQLPADCLNEIFEHVEDNRVALLSCLLVNRLWCEVSVRFLWKDVRNYSTLNFRTLIACFPNESKEILCKNGIIIPTPTSNPPMFNYAAYCKVISCCSDEYSINCKVERLLKNQQSPVSSQQSLDYSIYIVTQEIYKLFMNQISSLKKLYIWNVSNARNITFTSYPGAEDCLKNLSELYCNSDIYPEFFYQLSQICHNIQLLTIEFRRVTSNGLAELISVQKNLKHLNMRYLRELSGIIPSLSKLSNTLIKFNFYGGNYIPLSFITKFTNLQELDLFFYFDDALKDFKILQYVTFPQLQILKIRSKCPRHELLIKFLENNGKNLKELYVGEGDYSTVAVNDNSLNLAIVEFCPNLRRLSTGFKNDDLETLEMVFNSCKYLESIKIWCGGVFLSEEEAFEAVVNYSTKNFCELILYHLFHVRSELLPKNLESFFTSWTNRIPQKQLSLIIVKYNEKSLDTNDENMKLIKKYIKLGIIKNFKVTGYEDKVYG